MKNFRTGKISNCIDKWLETNKASTGAGGVLTIGEKRSAPCDFFAVRLHYYNGTTGTPTISACVGATESPFIVANQYNGLSASDNASQPIVGGAKYASAVSSSTPYGWVDVTFSGSTTVVLPAGTANAPTITSSDIMPLMSVPRVDDPTKPPMILHRVYAASGLPFQGAPTIFPGMGYDQPANRGRLLQTFDASSNAVGTKTTSMASPANSYMTSVAIEYFSLSGGSTIMVCGDSVASGYGQLSDLENGALTGWGFRAAADISSKQYPVGYMNVAISGAQSSVYLPQALVEIAKYKPSTVVYEVWSPNDVSSALGGSPTSDKLLVSMTAMVARAAQMVDLCASIGATCVLMTAIPNPAANRLDTYALDSIRQQLNALLLSTTNVVVVDLNSVVSGGESGTYQTIQTKYLYQNDNVHFNALGHEDVAVSVARSAFRLATNAIPDGNTLGNYGNLGSYLGTSK